MPCAAPPDAPTQCFLWPCNVQAWGHWCAVQTMWAVDGGVRTGLRAADVLAYLGQVARLRADERARTYTLLQACEREALQVYREHWELDEQERERQRRARR